MIGAELLERAVEARHGALRGRPVLAARDPRFGRDYDIVALDALDRPADYAFGAIDSGGVEQIDPEIERLPHQSHRLGLTLAGPEPEPAEAAAAEPGDADPEPGTAERDVFHQRKPIDSQGMAATIASAITSAPM